VSPILVRPVREQLEHDRVIRLLQAKWKKRYEVEVNIGDERNVSVQVGPATLYPDLVLKSPAPPRRIQGIVEVETGESVNNLEAMAQWAHMGRAAVPFQLYVPQQSVDIARRLCEEHQVGVAELWTYMPLGDQLRFTLVHRNPELAEPPQPAKAPAKAAARAGEGEEAEAVARPAGEAPEPAAPAKAAKPAPRKAKPGRAAGRKPARAAVGPSKRTATTRAARPSGRPASRAAAKGTARSRSTRSASPARKAASARGATRAGTPGAAKAGRRPAKGQKTGKSARKK
jgi:hypothetical protein